MNDMLITFYTTHCPKCRVLKMKLDSKHLEYGVVDDVEVMQKMGIHSAPQLMVDGQLMDFKTAVDWVNSLPIEEDKFIK